MKYLSYNYPFPMRSLGFFSGFMMVFLLWHALGIIRLQRQSGCNQTKFFVIQSSCFIGNLILMRLWEKLEKRRKQQ